MASLTVSIISISISVAEESVKKQFPKEYLILNGHLERYFQCAFKCSCHLTRWRFFHHSKKVTVIWFIDSAGDKMSKTDSKFIGIWICYVMMPFVVDEMSGVKFQALHFNRKIVFKNTENMRDC